MYIQIEKSISKNWIDPFEGIETLMSASFSASGPGKNWIDPFEGIETLFTISFPINYYNSKNWIDPFEGIETN